MTRTFRRRVLMVLLLTYAPLSIAGAVLHQSSVSIAALLALLAALATLLLHRDRPLASLLWLALAVPMAGAMLIGHVQLALDAVPVLFNAALAWLFGHTLAAGQQPLVARIICIIDGAPRLKLPGVARYARQVTAFWAVLLGVQALLLLVLSLCEVPDGALASTGIVSPWPLQAPWIAWYMHFGTYLVPILGMALEYAFRRWRLRHIPHSSLRRFIVQLVACWPQLLRDDGPSA